MELTRTGGSTRLDSGNMHLGPLGEISGALFFAHVMQLADISDLKSVKLRVRLPSWALYSAVWPSGKAVDFDSMIVGSNPATAIPIFSVTIMEPDGGRVQGIFGVLGKISGTLLFFTQEK